MKLYATVTSERASKGQGGNDYIVIKLQNDKKEVIATMSMYPKQKNQTHEILRVDYQRNVVDVLRIPWDDVKTEKGEKQKGNCGHKIKQVDCLICNPTD